MLNGTRETFEDLRIRIADAQTALPKRLAQAATYVLAHPEDMALGTAASVSKSARVQPSTLVRLAQHLGYDGFSDLQLVFRERLKRRASTYEERLVQLKDKATAETIEGAVLYGFVAAAQKSIERASSGLGDFEFAKAVSVLARAETIYLIARRRSYPITAHLTYAFTKLRIRTVHVDSSIGINAELVALARPTDAAFVCSFSPYASETIDLANALREQGVPIVAITDSAISPLAGLASVWLEITEHDYAGFRSIAASMAVASALPVAVAERRRHM